MVFKEFPPVYILIKYNININKIEKEIYYKYPRRFA
jgi:hypothetical protein